MRSKTISHQLIWGRCWQVSVLTGLWVLVSSVAGLPSLAQTQSSEPESTAFPSTPESSETGYTLGAGDRLRVDIFQVTEFSGEYLVLVDGTLNLPLAGNVEVEGLTLPEATEIVSQRYALYLKRPVVTLSLLNPRPLKIAISGEVKNPGSYSVNVEDLKQFPSVTNLIQLAGGITTAADVRQVQVRRLLDGREQLLTVDLWELLSQGNLNQDVTLRDGDTVFIPTTENINVAETRRLADASFGIQADRPINVAIIGEVYRPGSYQIEPEQLDRNRNDDGNKSSPPRLTQALAAAGGIKPLADVRSVEVRRLTRTGEPQTIDVDLWALLQTGSINEDVILQEGDTIVIPTAEDVDPSESESLAAASFSPATIRVNVVGEVEEPGLVEVPPNTPLNQALLAAGGFAEERANTDKVELIRLNPNGTVSKREIEVDLAAGIDEETNPTLRNNDVVVVNRSGLARVTDTLGSVLAPVGTTFSVFRIFNLLF